MRGPGSQRDSPYGLFGNGSPRRREEKPARSEGYFHSGNRSTKRNRMGNPPQRDCCGRWHVGKKVPTAKPKALSRLCFLLTHLEGLTGHTAEPHAWPVGIRIPRDGTLSFFGVSSPRQNGAKSLNSLYLEDLSPKNVASDQMTPGGDSCTFLSEHLTSGLGVQRGTDSIGSWEMENNDGLDTGPRWLSRT